MELIEMLQVYMYSLYLVISIALTIWVAKTLHKNGRVFLVESFGGNKELADSVNHLLVVCFYLINVGFVTLALKTAQKPVAISEVMEILSTKIGWVLLILGFMHFFNLGILTSLRKRPENSTPTVPVPPAEILP